MIDWKLLTCSIDGHKFSDWVVGTENTPSVRQCDRCYLCEHMLSDKEIRKGITTLRGIKIPKYENSK